MPVHYRVYDNNGEATSKTSFDETDTALGRIDVLSIPPLYSVASLKRRLIKAEEISDLNPQLFEDEDSETAMNDGDATGITLWAETYPGITEDEPIIIVYKAQNMVTISPPAQSPQSSAMSVYTGKFNNAPYASNENIFVVLLDGWVERSRVLVFTTFTKDAYGNDKRAFDLTTQYVLGASDANFKKFSIRDLDKKTFY